MMRRRPGDVAALGTVLACCAVVGVVLFWSRAMPTLGDYGEWTYHGVLLRDVLLRHANPMYGLKHYPVPNSLTTVGLGVLMLVLPWKVAAKCWLMCEVLLGAWCGYKLHRAADDRRVHGADLWDGGGQAWRLLVLPGAVLFGITFWAGFTNFMFGTYLAMLLA